jgi:hypothetical protein
MIEWLRARMIDDARHAWRWLSMRAMALDTAFLVVWATLPDDLKQALPSWLVPTMAVFVLCVGMIGRILKQSPPGSGAD